MGGKARALKLAAAGVGIGAAGLWFWSAATPLPPAPGAEIGGTLPTDPFNVALAWSATLNQWAAGATGLAVLLSAVADLLPQER